MHIDIVVTYILGNKVLPRLFSLAIKNKSSLALQHYETYSNNFVSFLVYLDIANFFISSPRISTF